MFSNKTRFEQFLKKMTVLACVKLTGTVDNFSIIRVENRN